MAGGDCSSAAANPDATVMTIYRTDERSLSPAQHQMVSSPCAHETHYFAINVIHQPLLKIGFRRERPGHAMQNSGSVSRQTPNACKFA